jgi:hypothetical protein
MEFRIATTFADSLSTPRQDPSDGERGNEGKRIDLK